MESTQYLRGRKKDKTLDLLLHIALNPNVEQRDLPSFLSATYKTTIEHLRGIRDDMLVLENSILNDKKVPKNRFKISLRGLAYLAQYYPNITEFFDDILAANNFEIKDEEGVSMELFTYWNDFKKIKMKDLSPHYNGEDTAADMIRNRFIEIMTNESSNQSSLNYEAFDTYYPDRMIFPYLFFPDFFADEISDYWEDLFDIYEDDLKNNDIVLPEGYYFPKFTFPLKLFITNEWLSTMFEEYLLILKNILKEKMFQIRGLEKEWFEESPT